MGINLNKSTIRIPKNCIKLASSHIIECLTSIFNQSLQQGVVPNILKISKATPIDKGGEITDLANYRPYQLYQLLHKYLKNVSITNLLTTLKSIKSFFNFNLGLEKDIQLPKL